MVEDIRQILLFDVGILEQLRPLVARRLIPDDLSQYPRLSNAAEVLAMLSRTDPDLRARYVRDLDLVAVGERIRRAGGEVWGLKGFLEQVIATDAGLARALANAAPRQVTRSLLDKAALDAVGATWAKVGGAAAPSRRKHD
jgi:hypothetical protein